MPSETTGKYKIIKETGRGGMATVHQAYDRRLERVVALKMPLPEYARDRTFVQRFLREARTAAKLDHPNIVTVFDVGEEDGIPYFTMQYVDQTLQDWVQKRGMLAPSEVIRIVGQVASALDYAHERGYVHRDVKPSNVLVTEDGQAVLTDFGIAKAADSISLTRTGELVGSPSYMSPEQIEGRDVDYRSDIYSLGVVCYEMLTGRPPFTGPTAAVLHAHVYETPRPLQDMNPQVPAAAARVVAKALAKKRDDRYASAGQMASALNLALTRGRSAEPPPPPGRRPAIPKHVMAAVLGVLALVLLYVVWPKPVPTPGPSPTPTWTRTPREAALASTRTPTPSPARTQVPVTPTQTPVPPTPTPAPTPTCARVINHQLAGAWDRSRLGCPTGDARTVWAAWQPFERGYMFWRSDTRRVTVFFNNRTWTEYSDQWVEGAPIPSRGSPPPGLLAPVRGFGYIWGIHDSVATGIGWALEEEKGFCALIQPLERGFVFRSSGVTFCQDELYNWATDPSFTVLFLAVYSDGTWQQW
jgi:serine/threonine protein kinase